MSTANTSNTESNIRGKLVTMKLKADSSITMHAALQLSYDKEYLLIEGCPNSCEGLKVSGLTDKEIEIAWLSFKKYAKKNLSKNPIQFSKNPLKYNISDGLIAIYTYDGIKVTKTSVIWEDNLKNLGYTRDESLPIPFLNMEAYYDSYRDELLAIG